MATLRPFRAIRPVPEKANAVASVPYDVVDTSEARLLAENNPYSFLHIVRPEIDMPEGTDLYDEAVYKKGARNFTRLIDEKILIEEEEPCVYIYRLIMDGHEQVGIAACCSVEEYDNNTILKHEHTRKEKEDDRVRHMMSVSAHHGPVLMTYRGNSIINTIAAEETREEPMYDFTSPDGIRHTLWRARQTQKISRAFKAVPFIYIADGHHRAAGAGRVKQEIRKKYPGKGDEEYNYFLAVLFPSEQVKILAYNRVVSDLNGLSEKEFLRAVKERFTVISGNGSEPSKKGMIGMYLNGKWYELTVWEEQTGSADPVSVLDLSIFQEKLLTPVLGIKDLKSDKRIDFIGGQGSIGKLKKRVDTEGGAAFTFFPVNVSGLLAVADAGMIMPPKSTWFVPKLRSGLLTHRF